LSSEEDNGSEDGDCPTPPITNTSAGTDDDTAGSPTPPAGPDSHTDTSGGDDDRDWSEVHSELDDSTLDEGETAAVTGLHGRED